MAFVVTGCTETMRTSETNPSDIDMSRIEYGRKLVLIMGCIDCHTPSPLGLGAAMGSAYGPEEDWLTGAELGFYGPYGTAYPVNLRLLISEIDEKQWIALAQNLRQDSPMAWSRLPDLNTEDLRAIYRYIEYLGPKGVHAPPRLPPGVKPTTKYFYFPLPH